MSKFSGPYDANFRCILDCMEGFLDFHPTQQLWKAILRRDDKAVRKLLERGADPDLQNLSGRSALHLAIEAKSESITKLLLEIARKIDLEDDEGKTALNLAAASDETGIVKLLKKKGAVMRDEDTQVKIKKFHAASENQKTPLHDQPVHRLPTACINACYNFQATITDFSFRWEDQEHVEKCRFKERSVFETLYGEQDENYGSGILRKVESKSKQRRAWKWYHFPANNVCTTPL